VDPLGIFGQLSKAVDALLIHGSPLGHTHSFTGFCLQLLNRNLRSAHVALPVEARARHIFRI
jgi:hypothetical protein